MLPSILSTPDVTPIRYFYFTAEIVIIYKQRKNKQKRISRRARYKMGPRNIVTHQFCILELCFQMGLLISKLHDSQHAIDQGQKTAANLHLFLGIQFSTSGNSSVTGKKSMCKISIRYYIKNHR